MRVSCEGVRVSCEGVRVRCEVVVCEEVDDMMCEGWCVRV